MRERSLDGLPPVHAPTRDRTHALSVLMAAPPSQGGPPTFLRGGRSRDRAPQLINTRCHSMLAGSTHTPHTDRDNLGSSLCSPECSPPALPLPLAQLPLSLCTFDVRTDHQRGLRPGRTWPTALPQRRARGAGLTSTMPASFISASSWFRPRAEMGVGFPVTPSLLPSAPAGAYV